MVRSGREFITESDVQHAASYAMSNTDAANFLRINPLTWRKYAMMYFEPTTGKTYYEYLKVKRHIKNKKLKKENLKRKKSIVEILDGLHPSYQKNKLHHRLLKEGYMDECCSMCGFIEKHLITNKCPLFLVCKDGDNTNFKRDNLGFFCYNCVALYTDYKLTIK